MEDALRTHMLEYTTAIGFGRSGLNEYSFEWPATEWRKRWVLHIKVNPNTGRLILSGDSLGVTVCDQADLPLVLEAVEEFSEIERERDA